MTKDNFRTQCDLARVRVADYDRIDGYKDRDLPTIAAAMETGLRMEDNGPVYDAFVMLEELAAAITA